MCRKNIGAISNLIVIGEDNHAEEEKIDSLPSKGTALLKILEDEANDPNKRYLIFSAHEASFKGLREILSSKGMRCEMLYGSGARIERLRKQFQDGTVRVLCMNARHVGAGINLESATTIILYHRMNTELENQVIGRAIRFERTKDLQVIHLVHEQETTTNGESSSEVIIHM
jgi:SNF2 family DNA or RNA helicase